MGATLRTKKKNFDFLVVVKFAFGFFSFFGFFESGKMAFGTQIWHFHPPKIGKKSEKSQKCQVEKKIFSAKKKKKIIYFFFWNMNFVFEGSFFFLLSGLF